MPECSDAKLFQVLGREARQDPFVDLILAEDNLVFPEAKAPQPNHDVHYGAPNSGLPHIIVRAGESVQEVPKCDFQCQSVPLSKQCHARYSRTERQSVPEDTIGDQRTGRAITIGWDAGEAWRLIVTVSNSATVVTGTPLALWRCAASSLFAGIACSVFAGCLRRQRRARKRQAHLREDRDQKRDRLALHQGQ